MSTALGGKGEGAESSQGSEGQTWLLQLGWTTNNDVLLRVTPKDWVLKQRAASLSNLQRSNMFQQLSRNLGGWPELAYSRRFAARAVAPWNAEG